MLAVLRVQPRALAGQARLLVEHGRHLPLATPDVDLSCAVDVASVLVELGRRVEVTAGQLILRSFAQLPSVDQRLDDRATPLGLCGALDHGVLAAAPLAQVHRDGRSRADECCAS